MSRKPNASPEDAAFRADRAYQLHRQGLDYGQIAHRLGVIRGYIGELIRKGRQRADERAASGGRLPAGQSPRAKQETRGGRKQ